MNRYAYLATAILAAILAAGAGCGHESAASQQARVAPPPVEVEPVPAEAAAPAPDEPLIAPSDPPAETAIAQTSAPQTQPARPTGQRPPADRGPTRPGDAEKVTFDDLNLGMTADMVYRPFLLTDRAKELDGKRVSIVGYMHGGVDSAKNNKEFILLKNTECKFGPGGQADHLADIKLKAGETTRLTREAVKVEGTLKIEPYQGPDGNTWSLYRLEDAKIVR
jgi:hypothetical protein